MSDCPSVPSGYFCPPGPLDLSEVSSHAALASRSAALGAGGSSVALEMSVLLEVDEPDSL